MTVIVGGLPAQVPAAAQQEFQGFTDWAAPENLGPPLNTAAEESAPAISDDGLGLYFNRNPNLPDDRDEDLEETLDALERAIQWSRNERDRHDGR